jgi:ribosomal protein S18 acetylase RimI-like enzyme
MEVSGLPLRPRPYADADFEDCAVLWERCGLKTWYNPPDRDIARWLNSPNSEILVISDGNALLGSVCVGHDGHRGWLYALAVDPEHQHKGYGRQLVRAAEAWLEKHEIPKVQLMVRSTNTKVAGFYRSLGYHSEPRSVFARWLDDPGPPPEGAPTPDWLQPEAETPATIDYTITFLEMTQRPTVPAPHPPSGLSIALLRAVEPSVRFYRFLYDGVGEPWIWWERRQMSDAALAAVVTDPAVEVYVLYVEGTPAGYAEVDRRDPKAVDLAYFGLLPEFTGKGLGPYLLSAALDIAWSSDPERVTVNTCTLDHPKALPLYQRFGFQPIRQERRSIRDPRGT